MGYDDEWDGNNVTLYFCALCSKRITSPGKCGDCQMRSGESGRKIMVNTVDVPAGAVCSVCAKRLKPTDELRALPSGTPVRPLVHWMCHRRTARR